LAVGIDNVLEGRFSRGRDHRISAEKFEALRKFQARPGDVLITVMATVGRSCVFPADAGPAIITKHVYRITVDPGQALPVFISMVLRGAIPVLAQIANQVRGQTRPGINGAILKSLEVPVPPIVEQLEIVRRVEALFAFADTIEQRVAAATARADRLTQVILAKAFRGELAPNTEDLAGAMVSDED
jgi:type I restriction enzyme S subunit